MEIDDEGFKFGPVIVLFVGILAVSTASILIRYAQEGASSLVIAAYRLSIAALILAPAGIIRFGRKIINLPLKDKLYILASGVFLALHFASWITSLELTSITSSVVLVTTTPLWVALLSPLVLKEKISKGIWIGMVIAILGSILVALQDSCDFQNGLVSCSGFNQIFSGQAMIGNVLALFGAWMAAGYMLMGRKVRSNLPVTAYIFSVYAISAFILLFFVLVKGLPLLGYSQKTYLWLFLLALLPQLLGHSSFNWALGYLPAAFVSIALVGEPIGTIILAFFLLQEIPAGLEILGGLLILIGIFIVTMVNQKKHPEKSFDQRDVETI